MWPPINLSVATVIVAAVVLLFLWPLRATRKAKGRALPPSAGVPEQGRALLYFHSAHCGSCRQVGPLVDDIAAQGKPVFKFDVAEARELTVALGVRVVPTVVVAEDGRVVEVLAGNHARRVSNLVL